MHRIHQISVSDCLAMGGNVPLAPSHPHGDLVPVPDPSPLSARARVPVEPATNPRLTPPGADKLARVMAYAATFTLLIAGHAKEAYADHRPLCRPLRVVGSGSLPPFAAFPAVHTPSVRTRGDRVYPRRYSSPRQQRRWVVIRDQDAGWLTPPSRFARTRQGHPLVETPTGVRCLLPVPRSVAQPH